MNILVLSWRDPKHPLAGGAEQVMHEHMKGWARAGHSVTLFASHYKNAPRRENLDDIKILRYGFQYLGVHISVFFWYLFGTHEKFDLVVDQFHGIPFFTPLYVQAKKLAVLQEVAREVWLENYLPWPFNWPVGIIGYFAEPLIFRFYRNVPFMVGSESAKSDLVKMGISPANIYVVPHGIVLVAPKPLPDKERIKTVMFLGILTKDKGVEDAVKAFSIIDKEKNREKFNFWVVGKGSDKYIGYLKGQAKDANIRFFGFVNEEKKFELLARAHILVNPSAREGFGLVNIEANAMGTPVVAYPSPGLVDSVKDGVSGIICRKNSPEEMGRMVENLLKNKGQYEKLQKGAISWSKNFSWKKSRKRSLTLINSIVR